MVRSDHVSDETGVNWARTCMPDMRIRMRLSFAINGNDSPNGSRLLINRHITCAVKRRWTTAGESPARELGSLHPEAIRAAVEETKPSEPLV